MQDLVLKPGRERAVRRRHPWVLSGAVARQEEKPGAAPGGLARIVSHRGEVLGWADVSPASNIRARILAFGSAEPPGDLVASRVSASIARRQADPLIGETDAVRLVNAEGDALPGLVVDRYADVVVAKFSTVGMRGRQREIVEALREATGAAHGYERADTTSARREGLAATSGVLWGAAPTERTGIAERDRRFRVDVIAGQKTGFYLDQRDARDLVGVLASGRRVLDLFSYTGGFAVAAARAGAERVTLVESSSAALEVARGHLETNAPECPATFVKGDAFEFLRAEGGEHASESWDLIVLDPPPLARRKADVPRATRAYKDALIHSLRRAGRDAWLLAFACSHHVGPDLFQKVVFGASLDAGRSLRVLRTLGAPSDHPVSIDHPEGRYLTGLLLAVE